MKKTAIDKEALNDFLDYIDKKFPDLTLPEVAIALVTYQLYVKTNSEEFQAFSMEQQEKILHGFFDTFKESAIESLSSTVLMNDFESLLDKPETVN